MPIPDFTLSVGCNLRIPGAQTVQPIYLENAQSPKDFFLSFKSCMNYFTHAEFLGKIHVEIPPRVISSH